MLLLTINEDINAKRGDKYKQAVAVSIIPPSCFLASHTSHSIY